MAGSRSHHHQYSYVEDELQFPQELICTVCHDVAGTHAACPGCSQTFCQNCVHKWFDTQKSNAQGCTCPYCRRRLRFSDLKHDLKIQQQLDQLQVHCPNQEAGCTAVVARGSVPSHLKRDCWAQQCSCKFCGLQGLRQDISQHESCECEQRLVPCSNAAAGCSASVPSCLLQEHLEHSCPAAQRACPHCQQLVQRRSWGMHLQHRCPASQPCPLRLYGCSYSGNAQEAVPAAALPQMMQQDAEWLVSRAAAAEAASRPATLAAQTAPQQLTQQASSDTDAAGAVAGASSSGMSIAEALALGRPHCFALVQRLGSGPPLPAKRRTPRLLHGLAPLEALELATALLLLSSARAMHVETAQIPSLPPMMMASYRLFWGPSVLAGCGAWLGRGVQLGWQAVAVLSDMLMEVADRFMQALGGGFYDPDEMRVPLAPRMTMAAAQLVLPAGLLRSCLQRVVGLSRAFHDEECADLSEVTWSGLAARLGLSIELDKLVSLVEEQLPVAFEDEDEDEEDYMEDEEEEAGGLPLVGLPAAAVQQAELAVAAGPAYLLLALAAGGQARQLQVQAQRVWQSQQSWVSRSCMGRRTLREMHLQQSQGGSVWPMAHFEELAHDALEQACAERRQQRRALRRMQQLAAGEPGGSAAAAWQAGSAAAAAGMQQDWVAPAGEGEGEAASGSASEDGSDDMSDLDIEPEALDLLAAAAEDFLVQQLGAAADLALDAAGRQEVGGGDVRMALAARGLGHMLAQLQRDV
ncbi:hypothetical protein COO60DRAFT_1661495 [Scenedesmus sp. NREL 46B-D3]|nr:hypothetical protein COO60DRAFT_1661495 [Scenedesmus sp. NREL 46B-D3]